MKVWSVAAVALVCGVVLEGAWLRPRFIPRPASSAVENVVSPLPLADLCDRSVALADHAVEESIPPQRLDDPREPNSPAALRTPDSLPAESDAADSLETAKHAAVREVIDRILKDANAEERQIWFDELKGLPPIVVEDLLKVRRQFGMSKPKPDADHLGPLRMPVAAPRPATVVSHRWDVSIQALRQAREVHLHNLANVQTIGYQRLVPQASAAPPPAGRSDVSAGCQWQGLRLQEWPGERIETGRPLDIAIRGSGWLAVKIGEEIGYTRNGHLLLDDERRLCVQTPDGLQPLEPSVHISHESFAIGSNGAIVAANTEADKRPILGQILLAVNIEPTLLSCGQDGLLRLPPGAAPPKFCPPGETGAGSIADRTLERSNVDPGAEWREIELIDRWLQAVQR